MPPKRRPTAVRKVSGPTRQQSTLSFAGKRGVTKPSSGREPNASKKDPALFEDIAHTDGDAEADPDPDEPTTAEVAIQQQTDVEVSDLEAAQDPLHSAEAKVEDVLGGRAVESELGAVGGVGSGWVGDEEVKARETTDTQIKRYWREKEQKRLAPRVHQDDLSVYEKILREWDMSGQYGPCIGIARLKRWKRANNLGLKPPIEVLAVLLKEMDAGEARFQRAHVDELMSSRYVET